MKYFLFLFMMTTYTLTFGQVKPEPEPFTGEAEIFKVVERMPRFPGCEDKESERLKDDCAKGKMLEYIYKHLQYPEEAKINKIEGKVVLQFIVENDGSITDIKVVRDPGAGCGLAVIEVIESMKHMTERWIPGHQRGRPVRVLYTLPVGFKLN